MTCTAHFPNVEGVYILSMFSRSSVSVQSVFQQATSLLLDALYIVFLIWVCVISPRTVRHKLNW